MHLRSSHNFREHYLIILILADPNMNKQVLWKFTLIEEISKVMKQIYSFTSGTSKQISLSAGSGSSTQKLLLPVQRIMLTALVLAIFMLSEVEVKATIYTTAASGNWTTPATWGLTSGYPNNSSDVVNITSSYTVDQDVNINISQLNIASGGTYASHAAYTFTITGPGAIIVDGTYNNSGGGAITGSMIVNNGGTYKHSRNGSTIATATWNTGSTCLVTGITSTVPGGLNQSFYNFTWNCSSQTATINFLGALTDVAGTFTLTDTHNGLINTGSTVTPTFSYYVQTGGSFMMANGPNSRTQNVTHDFSLSGGTFTLTNVAYTGTLNVGGNFSVNGGTLTLSSGSSTGTLNVAGDFSHTSGIISVSGGTGAVIFNGTGTKTYTSGGTLSGAINFTVGSGSNLPTLQMGTSVSPAIISNGSTGTFTILAGATLGITSSAGITTTGATGNIQVTGTRTYSTGANYIYNGSGSQATGSGLPTAAITGNITIANGASVTLLRMVR